MLDLISIISRTRGRHTRQQNLNFAKQEILFENS